MTRKEKEQTGKYVLQMARLLEDRCYQQEMLLKAVHIIDEALEQEPKTGHWIDINGIYAKCSNCNEEIYITGDYKYCPNCGIKMESEE